MHRVYLGHLARYLRYYWRSRTRYDVHSPFVADFIQHILEDERQFYAFAAIEALRERLVRSEEELQVRDFGAGSQVMGSTRRRIREVVRHGAIAPAAGRQLFKLVHHYRPQHILEMGTSLGISTLYLAKASARSQIISLEGCPRTAALARRHLEACDAPQVEVRTGSFADTLPGALEALERLDLLYLDGDHRREPTLAYARACLEKAHAGSLFVIADIHWSADMEDAWATLRQWPQVRLSLDLFHFGLLFFDPALRQRRHYDLIRWAAKPWRMGLFHATESDARSSFRS